MALDLMPLLFVLDTSQSMGRPENDPPIARLSGLFGKITDACRSNLELKKQLWVDVITFSTDAHHVVDGYYKDLKGFDPKFKAGGLTCYGKAFRLLRRELDAHRPRLEQKAKDLIENEGSCRLNRPAVFFITDGFWQGVDGHDGTVLETEKECEAAWQAIVGMDKDRRPNVTALGLNTEDDPSLFEKTLDHYHCGDHGRSMVLGKGTDAAKQLEDILETIVESVVLSMHPDGGVDPRSDAKIMEAFNAMNNLRFRG